LRSLEKRHASEAAIVTKAALKAKELWSLTNKQFANIIGVSEPSVSRLGSGGRTINLKSKEGELSLLFLRTFRALDSLMGGEINNQRSWLTHDNLILKGVPLQMMQKIDGLIRVVEYLDAIRGH
jgi:hypothetical protein